MVKQFDEEMIKKALMEILKSHEDFGGAMAEELNQEIKEEPEEDLPDITEVDIRRELLVENPKDAEMYMHLKSGTPARLGVGKAGPRYKTSTMLRIRADLAAARDAVLTMVSDDLISSLHIPVYQTKAESKSQYLLRPDLGRIFDNETKERMKKELKENPDVQIVIGDGLSSTAIEANIHEILPALKQGLESYGIDPGTPVFVEYSRVGAGDFIAETMGAKLVIILIGERPGVASSESMSCYMTYAPKIGIVESSRTVISNIHRHGTPAAEAGAHIAELANIMLREKKSGVDLTISSNN